MSILLSSVLSAIAIGLGCGTCCSPVISTFLSTYVISHANGIKNSIWCFLSFFAGKILSVSLLCIVSSILGRQFIGQNGYIGTFNLRLFSQIVMSCIGIVLVIRWFFQNKSSKSCGHCHICSEAKAKIGFMAMFSAGITYGFTPCAPLIMIIGYSFVLSVPMASVIGIAFGIASAVSPIFLLAVISGALSKRIAKELPRTLKWFRLASYLVLVIMPFIIKIN